MKIKIEDEDKGDKRSLEITFFLRQRDIIKALKHRAAVLIRAHNYLKYIIYKIFSILI